MDNYYYFAPNNRRLRYGYEIKVEVGVTHTIDPPLELCKHGLHASRRAIDALQNAPGDVICIVGLGGEILHGNDKSCATERTYLEVIDGEDLLREFARRCALEVAHLWDVPDVVREYLETGDKGIREAARDAAWTATNAATQNGDRRSVRYAAWAATRYHAWDAAKNAARAASLDAARDATPAIRGKQNKRLEKMIQKKIKEKNDG